MVDVVASLMSLFTLPVLLVCVVDDWFLRPRRQLRGTAAAPVDDPLLMKILYTLLPVLVVASFYSLMTAQRANFSLLLVIITVVSGVVWLIDHRLLAPRRAAAARTAGRDPAILEMPGTVDYAQLLSHHGGAADRALVPLRAVSHPLRFDDAHAARWRFHPGQ
jgi:hypothetical protein